MQIVVMGVSGAGKSVIGRALAAQLSFPYIDGDDLHPAANIAKMRSGVPLDDDDRAPWLERVGTWLAQHTQGVVSCSALRRRYRDRLREAAPGARFVQLNVDTERLTQRLSARRGHFMPGSLLASQLSAFEPLTPDEHGVLLDNDGGTPDEIAARAVELLRR
ncbi:MAG TPA: gluconokinase [Polyangiales bacterium]